jgi:hypothetical protein
MKIQVNTDDSIQGDEILSQRVGDELTSRLAASATRSPVSKCT